LYCLNSEMQNAKLLQNGTFAVFLEFERRIKDNGNGTAPPIFIIVGNNKENIIGKNPNLSVLVKNDLKH
jgi:hypothetical protein